MKVEVVVVGSRPLLGPTVSVDVKQLFNNNVTPSLMGRMWSLHVKPSAPACLKLLCSFCTGALGLILFQIV